MSPVLDSAQLAQEPEARWCKVAWRWKWRETISFYMLNWWHTRSWGLGVRVARMDVTSAGPGGTVYKHWHLELEFLKWYIGFWIKWDYQQYLPGPGDPLEAKQP